MLAKNIDEVIGLLEGIIEESKVANSTLGYFAALYQKVTIAVKEKLHTNYFDDDARMEKLDVVFANRYLLAYSNYKQGKVVTESWKVAFELAESHKLIVLQHLLLGMNAHINLDLGIAAAEISKGVPIHSLESDFSKINEILAELVEEVQKSLVQIWPWLLKVLKFANKVDDLLVNFSMELARDGAWKFANELHQQRDEGSWEGFLQTRDQKVASKTDLITKHGTVGRIVFGIIRIGERGEVADKINVLR